MRSAFWSVMLGVLELSACAPLGLGTSTLDTAPDPLTSAPGDPAAGQAIFTDRAGGNCVLCHRVEGLAAPFQGDVGPDLTEVGLRLTQAQLRFRVVDASRLNPATVMPPYYRTVGLTRVAPEFRDRPVLTAEQVEHLVAYLASLRGKSS